MVNRLDANLFHDYLLDKGWEFEPFSKGLYVAKKIYNSDEISLIIPKNEDILNYDYRINQIINSLSSFEEKKKEDLLFDIQTYDEQMLYLQNNQEQIKTEIGSQYYNIRGIEYDFQIHFNRFKTITYHGLHDKIGNYYDQFLMNDDFIVNCFSNPDNPRLSSFRIKYLPRGAQQVLSQKLIKNRQIVEIYPRDSSDILKNSKIYQKLIKITNFWYNLLLDAHGKSVGHEPILNKIILHFDPTIAVELPVVSIPRNNFAKEEILLTGHLDLLFWDERRKKLIVADYKPEGNFLRSLPQVAFYGLILRKILKFPDIECLSFNREKSWLYSPDILKDHLIDDLKIYSQAFFDWFIYIEDFY